MSSEPMHEPSVFALDVYVSSGGTAEPQIAQHLATCARCAAYVSELEVLACRPLQLSAQRVPSRHSTAVRSVWAVWAAGSLLVASAVWLLHERRDDPRYVASKGGPAVQVLIRSASKLRIWDGNTALQAGDAVALRADCNHFEHLTVVVPERKADDAAARRVFDAACPRGDALLPFTLIADGQSGEERVQIVFSHARLDTAALARALAHAEHSSAIWVERLSLRKRESVR